VNAELMLLLGRHPTEAETAKDSPQNNLNKFRR
jgi:hypothetical protein